MEQPYTPDGDMYGLNKLRVYCGRGLVLHIRGSWDTREDRRGGLRNGGNVTEGGGEGR